MNLSNEERLYPTVVELSKKKEIINWRCVLDSTQAFLNFFGIRKTNKEYVRSELEWYLSQSLSVEFIGEKASLWKKICDDEGKINSNYGWCVLSKENGSQMTNALKALLSDKHTRRACMIYTRPSMHTDAVANGMQDFMCTNYVQLFIRGNRLFYTVHQRSCDFVYGFFNDFFWHCLQYRVVYEELKKTYRDLVKKDITYLCDSLHIYSRHYEMIDRIAQKIKEQR